VELPLVAIVLPWVGVAVGGWLGYALLRQNGRILLRLDALERQLRQSAGSAPGAWPSLPLGSPAPEFELPDLAGGRRALTDFRGRPVLLIFFSPRCGFCTQMAADLAALPRDGARGAPLPLIVTSGDPGENRALVEKHGIRAPVLRQETTEVSSRYKASGTPTGYLIDEQGRIASEIAVGAPALLALAARPSAGPGDRRGQGAAGKPPLELFQGHRSLAESRITRKGLPAGTPAPPFTLPRVDGGELSREAYRGRRLLLVFSDPECEPCDELARRLETLTRERPTLSVLMVSRGDPEANRRKVREHGLTFPVVLQRHWEVSRLYGIFATPVGYLIDEAGITMADVAVGPAAILARVGAAAVPTDGTSARMGPRGR
jgi:peroxiredoxin